MSVDGCVEIGRIYREHGVRGLCTFYSYDGTALNLKQKTPYHLHSPQRKTQKVKILEIKRHGRYFLLHFDCFHAPEEIRPWRGATLLMAKSDLDRLPGEMYDHEWVGLMLCCGDKVIGKIKGVVYTPQRQFVVQDDGEKFIPYVREWVVDKDLARGRIEMVLPEGL